MSINCTHENDHKLGESILTKVATTFVTIDLDSDHVEITPQIRRCDGKCLRIQCAVLIQAIASFIRRLVLDRVQLNFF